MDGMEYSFDESERELAKRLNQLEGQHRELDAKVANLHNQGADMIHIQRLKREKLRLKDEIARVRSLLWPNIIA